MNLPLKELIKKYKGKPPIALDSAVDKYAQNCQICQLTGKPDIERILRGRKKGDKLQIIQILHFPEGVVLLCDKCARKKWGYGKSWEYSGAGSVKVLSLCMDQKTGYPAAPLKCPYCDKTLKVIKRAGLSAMAGRVFVSCVNPCEGAWDWEYSVKG